MRISFIGCWYRDDMYSQHLNSLIEALEKEKDIELLLVTSNCSCFSCSQQYSIAKDELLNVHCVVIKTPYAPLDPNKRYGLFKYYLVKTLKLNYILETLRGVQFYRRTRESDIVHFDQVLRSFGTLSFITLLILSKMSGKKVIVTVHELDPMQEKHRKLNKYYSWADNIIVFSNGFRDKLIKLGIPQEKITTVPFCTPLGPIMGLQRNQFIYFGGHHLLAGKGFDILLGALDIIRSRGKRVTVLFYPGNCDGLEEGKQKVSDMKLDSYIKWSDFLTGTHLAAEYQKSIACLIPYTGGSGRHPATSAMANATPVIATKKADLPEYLGESGIYIKENSAQELADAMENLMNNPDVVIARGKELRKRAEEKCGQDIIGKEILKIYKELYAQG